MYVVFLTMVRLISPLRIMVVGPLNNQMEVNRGLKNPWLLITYQVNGMIEFD